MTDQIDPAQSPTVLGKLLKVFIAPRETFHAIAASIEITDLFVPLIITLIAGMSIQSTIRPIAIAEQRQKVVQSEKYNDEQKDAILDRIDSQFEKTGGVSSYILPLIVGAVYPAVIAGILMFFGAFILGGRSTFQQTWSLVIYVQLIGLIELLVKFPLWVQTQSIERVETGLALLLPISMQGDFLYRWFHSLDFFSMWRIFLMSMGVAILYKVDEKRARFVLFLAWLIVTLLWTVVRPDLG